MAQQGSSAGERVKHRKRRIRHKTLNAQGQEAQHFLLSAAACTLTQREVARMSDDEAYERFKAIRFAENDGKPFCPHCGHVEVYDITTRRIFKCAACRRTFSVTSGTIFASRKMSIGVLLSAVLSYVNGVSGTAAVRLRRDTGLSYKSAFVLCHKLREALGASRSPRLLCGEVEFDGVQFDEHQRKATLKKHEGRRNSTPNRFGKENTQVIVAARERGVGGESRVTVVDTHETRGSDFVRSVVDKGATFISDEGNWSALFSLHDWKRVKHSVGYKVDGVHTNGVESLFARVRRAARGVHYKMRGKNLDLYAQEISWREDNRRVSNGEQLRMVVHAGTHHPVSGRFKGYWQRHLIAGAVRRSRAVIA